MKNRCIVLLVPDLNEGGVERIVVEINRELARRGAKSIVISRGGRLVHKLEEDGGRHITLDVGGKNPLSVPWRAWRLRRLLHRLEPDLVHVHSRVPAWLLYYADRKTAIPVVSTVHGFNRPGRYSRIMTRGVSVICGIHALKDYVQHHYGVEDARLCVIANGVDMNEFNPANVSEDMRRDLRARFCLGDSYVVTIAARFTSWKGHEVFLRALASARREDKTLIGLVVGGGDKRNRAFRARLDDICAKLGLSDSVRFAGSFESMAGMYAISDVVVSASVKPESFGLTMAEALAMETPVVATAHGGALDIMREGRTGFLVPPGDVDALARGILKAREYTGSGLRQHIAAHFTFRQMLDKTMDVYARVIAGEVQRET